jgi:superfamily II DNA/RNA helicase
MTVSFEQLGVGADLAGSLEAVGIRRPFPVQALTIPDALSGRDVCGKAKTGSGKTLAFGLPLLSRVPKAAPRAPTGLVLVPTRELAVQVEGVLTSLAPAVSRTVVAVYGGVPIERQIEALGAGADVVVATPGRLIDLFERREVVLDAVAVLVLDEADRMADMGFTPQVEWLLRRVAPTRQTMLFSATLDGDVDHLVRHYLTDPVRHEVASERPTVEQMEHRFLAVHQMDKVRVAAAIARGGDKTLVFVRTKHMADRLARDLATEGVRAAAIHGDLRQSLREASLARFSAGKLPVLVATDVAARGLDIDAVDTVIHYDPPEDHKAYLHRSGRTARAGDAGLVVTLVLWNQLLEVERVQRRLGLRVPVVEVFSNDPRLSDLAAWDPSADAA